jgi:hypothetical protein
MTAFKEELLKDVTSESGLLNREEEFLNKLFDEFQGDIRSAMNAVGYPKDTPTSVVTKKLHKQIQERSREFIAASTARASLQLVNIYLDPTAPGAKNIIATSKEILDRGGVYKEERVQVQDESNMFILPPKNSED